MSHSHEIPPNASDTPGRIKPTLFFFSPSSSILLPQRKVPAAMNTTSPESLLTVRPVQQTPTCSLPSTVPSGCSHAPQQKETMKQEFVCMCVLFFFCNLILSLLGLFPLLPPLPHFTVKKNNNKTQPHTADRQFKRAAFVE